MLTVDEIIKATKGRLIQGNLRAKLDGISTDSRQAHINGAFLALKGYNFDGHDFIAKAIESKATCIITSKVIGFTIPRKIALIQVKDTTVALGQIAFFQRSKFNLPVITVTGSNGKTTTKEMIAWVLSGDAQVLKNEGTKNNHIGLPQTLIQLKKSDNFAVVEIGTNHFGEVANLAKIASGNIGVITNIGHSHLEFLKNLSGVFKEKTALLNNLSKPKIAILNADDKLLKPLILRPNKGTHVFSFGVKERCDFKASAIRVVGERIKFKVNQKFELQLSSLGQHNIYNALAAVAVGRILGLDYSQIAVRLESFSFPKGRLNLIQSHGTKFIDDTYNSNPLSLSCALSALDAIKCKGRKMLIMGDMLELGSQKESLHRQIASSITNTCDLLITVGNLAKLTALEANRLGFEKKKIYCCASALEARELLLRKINPRSTDLILIKGSRSMKMEEVFKV